MLSDLAILYTAIILRDSLLMISALPVLKTGYPVAITRVHEPGINFHVNEKNDISMTLQWHVHTPIDEYFSQNYVFV